MDTKLYSNSDNTSNYKKFNRTLTGKNKSSSLSVEKVNTALIEHAKVEFEEEDHLYLMHDPSDLRKKHSNKTENIGEVRDLSGNIINGFYTFNTIALSMSSKKVALLHNETYSNKQPDFLSRKEEIKLSSYDEIPEEEPNKELYESKKYINKKIVSKQAISTTSKGMKANNSNLRITHILDREFDDNEYMDYINLELEDDFIIRSKTSRTSEDTDDEGKKIKLINSKFKKLGQINFNKLIISKKVIQDGCIEFNIKKIKDLIVVKVVIKDSKGKAIFDNPMMLITNKKVENINDAHLVYKGYMKRSKIEYVFKFLKNELGWEKLQVQKFEAFKNTISLAFYACSYLYNIANNKEYNDFILMLCKLGKSKGKVTRHFILQGIQALKTYNEIKKFIVENEISDEQIEEMINMGTIS